MLVAFIAPRLGFGLVCGALLLHLRPEVPAKGYSLKPAGGSGHFPHLDGS
jgi:hypothetical protein